MKEHMDRFPARFPPDLKKALTEKAAALPGTSMNDLVVLGVRHVVEGADLVVSGAGVADAHADVVVKTIEGLIAPAKGMARHYFEHGQPNLAGLIYWVAARTLDDPRMVAAELVRSADQIRPKSRVVAKALLRAALDHNPESDVIKSRLGQMLFLERDYAGAVELLERVREDDNYAKLFYGWAALELAADKRDSVERARDEIVVALRRWSLSGQRSPESRERWLNHVARLRARGPDFEQAVADLVAYANDNAAWTPVEMSELKPLTKTTASAMAFEELSGEN